jgi:hypothetical protein
MKKKLPRHSGGSFELKEGTGPITAMCPCGEFLEIFKMDKTFRVKSPESIDPDETNPNALWVASPVSDVGSANRIVARVLLQGHEMVHAAMFDREVNKEAVTKQLHSCKELILTCEAIARRMETAVNRIVDQIDADGVSLDTSGRGLNPFPQVQDLDEQCGSFLTHANRAIKLICELPLQFLPLERPDTNFDHLAKTLATAIGETAALTEFVRGNAAAVRYLIDLRNFHEHPRKRRTIIENFSLTPDSRIQVPMWHLSDQQPRPIKDEMIAATDFLLQLAETMLIHLVMHAVTHKFPFVVEEIQEDRINPDIPIRYKLSVDFSRLRMGK